jgi:hypothetical protein
MAVKRRKLGAKPTQIENSVDPAQQVIARHPIFETKLIEKTVLRPDPLTHHRPDPVVDYIGARESHQELVLNRVVQQPQPICDIRTVSSPRVDLPNTRSYTPEMAGDTQRRLAAIVSADVVGYSRLMGIDETGTLAALNAHRSELIDPLIGKYGGRIVKTMVDGLLLEFPSVVDATSCVI